MSSSNSNAVPPIQPVPRTPLAGSLGLPQAWLQWFNSIQASTMAIAANGAAITASAASLTALTARVSVLSGELSGAALLSGANRFTGQNTFETSVNLALAPVFGDAAGTRLALGLGSAATHAASDFLSVDADLGIGAFYLEVDGTLVASTPSFILEVDGVQVAIYS